jgi:hypothetical protein
MKYLVTVALAFGALTLAAIDGKQKSSAGPTAVITSIRIARNGPLVKAASTTTPRLGAAPWSVASGFVITGKMAAIKIQTGPRPHCDNGRGFYLTALAHGGPPILMFDRAL